MNDGGGSAYPIIDTETHFLSRPYADLLRSRDVPPRIEDADEDLLRYYPEKTAPEVFLSYGAALAEKFYDLDEKRLGMMEEHGISAQVVSLTIPGTDGLDGDVALEQARLANDALAEAVKAHPGKYIGLASLAPVHAEESAEELQRCVRELGFRGANLHSHVGDRYLDHESFRPIFAAAERLGVPINIHPTCPHASMLEPYLGYGWALAGPSLGFGHETALEVARMLYSGLFDDHPKLQLMLGHCGEALPFWAYRLDFPYLKAHARHRKPPKLERLPSEYLAQNVWYNCSGNFYGPALRTCLEAFGADRILFGSDYPYEQCSEAVDFLDRIEVSRADREKIAYGNACALFGLDTPATVTSG